MKPQVPLFAIDTSRGCAWRAFYVTVRQVDDAGWEFAKQIAHLGVDPTSSRPDIFGSIGSFGFRVAIPFTRWPGYKASRLSLVLYRRVNAFLHSIDGRFAARKA